ncbi:hypothetical protein JCM5353_001555 [Sporobolomyces roseus]
MQPTTPSTISNLPTLPTELVEEILRIETLEKQDLARCCLVSKLYLPTSRKQLYNELMILYGPLERDRYDWETVILHPTISSNLLLDTLRQHAFLRSLPSSLRLQRPDSDDYVERTGLTDANAIKTALQLMPNVKHLKLDFGFPVPQHLVSCSLDTNTTIICLEVRQLQAEAIPLLHNLRKLRIRSEFNINFDTRSEPLLPGLRVLDVPHIIHPPPPHFISRQLTALRISLKPDRFLDLSLLPRLEQLWLDLSSYSQDLVQDLDLASHTKLKVLYLSYIPSAHTDPSSSLEGATFFDRLIALPPLRKICIAFPNLVPWTSLFRHLESPAPFLANELCLSDVWLNNTRTRSSLAFLHIECGRREIGITFASEDGLNSMFSGCDHHLLHLS